MDSVSHDDNSQATAAIREYQTKLRELTRTAACGRKFIFTQRLTNWLGSRPTGGVSSLSTQGDRLLAAASHNKSEHDSQQLALPPFHVISDADNPCELLFCILFEIGAGSLIMGLRRSDKQDKHLPIELQSLRGIFTSIIGSNGKRLAEQFDKVQWKYCPAILELNNDKNFPKNRVIPIVKKKKINEKGGTAQLWQIEIPEEFVGKRLRDKAHASRYLNANAYGHYYHFALKVFKEGYKEQYDTERYAFNALQNNFGMITYLADYSHTVEVIKPSSSGAEGIELKPTHNILLEYGDFDLIEYFHARQPPSNQAEIEEFWEELFKVADAVQGIHDLEVPDGESVREYIGCHADIKPDNIIVVDKNFKLADPGFVKFVPKCRDGPFETIGALLGGTETYGAPERLSGNVDRLSHVQRNIDTWSLGCVFSMAASWVVLGWEGVRQFNKIRQSIIAKAVPNQDVRETETQKKVARNRADYFHDGQNVLRIVTEWHQVLRSCARKTDTMTALVLDLVDADMLVGASKDRSGMKKICMKLKEIVAIAHSEARISLPVDVKIELLEVDNTAPFRSSTSTSYPSTALSSSMESKKARKSKFLGLPMVKTAHRSSALATQSHSMATKAIGAVPTSNQQQQYTAVVDTDLHALNSNNMSVRIPEAFNDQMKTQRLASSPIPGPISRPTVRTTLPPPVKVRSITSQNVYQAREEIEQRHNKGFSRPFALPKRDALLSKYFSKRDIVFIVDNAESMKEHWYQATYLLETLVMKAKGQDENGMDLVFTSGNVEVEESNDKKKFLNAMKDDRARPTKDNVTDMRTRLDDIFTKYWKQVKSRSARAKVTVIILTDGIWAGMKNKDAVREQIVIFIKKLETSLGPLTARPFSIEFVRFGADADVRHRLERLDDELKWEGIPDIIDTEHCSGDVNKMLLGSFVEHYDEEDEHQTPVLGTPIDRFASPDELSQEEASNRRSTYQTPSSPTPNRRSTTRHQRESSYESRMWGNPN